MIDASIALGVKSPQIEDPMNSYAKLMQMQHAQQQNQLGMMQMDEYKRGVTEKTNFLAARRAAGDDQAAIKRVYGDFGRDQDYAKYLHEQAQTDELGAKTAGHKVKTAKDTQDFMDAAKRNLSTNPSRENIIAWGQDAVIKGFATVDQAQAEVNRYLSMTPAQRVAEMRKAGSSVEQLTPKFETVQTPGGGLRIGSTLDGSFTTNETLAPKVDANTAATNARIASEGRLNREQAKTLAGDVNKVVASTATDAAGNVIHFNKFGERIGAAQPVGKPSATFEKTAALRKQHGQDLNMMISEFENIVKPNGLIAQSTGSGAGRLYDAAAAFTGNAPEGAIAIAKLQPIADLALKMIPRFEGPQSDKDTASYKEAAGQVANAGLPREVRLAAANTVLRLAKARKGQFASEVMDKEGIAPAATKVITRTGMTNGRKVVQYSDGSIEYAD